MISLGYLSQQITIYIGICLFTAGLVGNGINIWVFISKNSYRTTPCTFYFLIGSMNNVIVVFISLSNRILTVGYGIDLTRLSNPWCKIREFSLVFSSCLSVTCSCLAMIDQYLVTSRKNSLRRRSQIKWTHRTMIIIITFWFLHTVPYLFYVNISSRTSFCTITNPYFNIYILIYVLGFLFVIPVSVMILFGWLTYGNIQQTIVLVNQNVDHQLVKMTLFQIGLMIVSYLPYGIDNLYTLITENVKKEEDRKTKESFIAAITGLTAYLFNTVCLKTSPCFFQIISERFF